MPPISSRLAAIGLLAAAVATTAHRDAVSPAGPAESLSLAILVDAASNPGHYAITAEFRFRLDAPEGDLFFFFPGAAGPEVLREIELNGQPVGTTDVVLAEHPRLRIQAFRLRVRSRGPDDVQALRVAGPFLAMPTEGMTRWGTWHPALGGWGTAIPIELEVRSDTTWDVIASGLHIGTTRDGGMQRSRWRTASPQGWVFLAIGRYARRTLVRDGITLELVHPDPAAAGDTSLFSRAFHVLRHLSSRFGRPRITSFRLIGFPHDGTQRFSHDGLVALSTQSFAPARQSPEYLASVLAHEFAHHWWGDVVRVDGPGEGWLSEGLAEYSRHLYERSIGGDSLAWAYRNLLVLSRFAGGTEPPTLALAGERAGADEIQYQKGAFVLYMLENEIGPDRFGQGLRDVVAAGLSGPLTLNEFESIMERRAGRSLGWFFEQWLDRTTGPVLSVEGAEVQTRGDGVVLRGAIRQEGSAYILEVPLRVELDASTIDTTIAVSDTITPFAIRLPARPRRMLVDPDSRLFKWYRADQLPITFADVWARAASGHTVRIEHDPNGVPERVVASFRQFLETRMGGVTVASAKTAATGGRVLLGEAAARYRQAAIPWLPEAPAAGTLRTYIARDTADAASFVVGIEGAWPETWPEVIPQVPWREITYRDGRMAGASTPLPPRIVVRLDR